MRARGQARVATNVAIRSMHTIETRRLGNEGPLEGKFEVSAQKLTRPSVRGPYYQSVAILLSSLLQSFTTDRSVHPDFLCQGRQAGLWGEGVATP